MKKSSEILGLKVISITEGRELGIVKELVVNPTRGAVAALIVDDGKWYYGAKVLPYMAVVSIGEYAVMVDNSEHLASISGDAETIGLLNLGIKVIGAKVLAKSGKIHGKTTEYTVDDTGKIISCEVELANGEGVQQLLNENILTFGKEVLIVKEQESV